MIPFNFAFIYIETYWCLILIGGDTTTTKSESELIST